MPKVEPRERPILFSGPMVRAILAGTKTQTRRVVKVEPGKLDVGENPACPYGVPGGSRLWVRETWYDDNATRDAEPIPTSHDDFIHYRADGEAHDQFEELDGFLRWRPSIFMPRWASRITLEVTEVRVERLQEITEADAWAEGIAAHVVRPIHDYAALWDSLNAKRGFGWDTNPWVWVVSFRRLTP